ncbi:hypothetical protein BJ508DRAFT_308919 [Ascobolus immersus RN42]|uniref:Uncharacterized protein n=1 Tax=Ascobolus immersus RN42 TaxID=1160509 RepID=A0A3N4IAV0_ASCIM|nr:hypothetical protein BJ508DRAFT_308919 [Ascobolus immersus RN42]
MSERVETKTPDSVHPPVSPSSSVFTATSGPPAPTGTNEIRRIFELLKCELPSSLIEDDRYFHEWEPLNVPADSDPTQAWLRHLQILRNSFNFAGPITLLTKAVLDFGTSLSAFEDRYRQLLDSQDHEHYNALRRLSENWATELTALRESPERLHAVDMMRFYDFKTLAENINTTLAELRSKILVPDGREDLRIGYLDPGRLDPLGILLWQQLGFKGMERKLRVARRRLNKKIDENQAVIKRYQALLDRYTSNSNTLTVRLKQTDHQNPTSTARRNNTSTSQLSADCTYGTGLSTSSSNFYETSAASSSTPVFGQDLIDLAPETKLRLWASRVYMRARQRLSISSTFTLDSTTSSAELCLSIISKLTDRDDVSNASIVGYRPRSMLLGKSTRSRLSELPVITNTMRGNVYSAIQASGNSVQINGNLNGNLKIVINQQPLADGGLDEQLYYLNLLVRDRDIPTTKKAETMYIRIAFESSAS